jgi:integrase
MGRKRTGTKEFRNGRWVIKLTVDLKDGGTERRRVELPEGTTEVQAEAKRLSFAAKVAGKRFDRREPLEASTPDLSYDDYVERWLRARLARGLRSVRKDRQRLRDFVSPLLTGKRMQAITPDHLRLVVSSIDQRIHNPEIKFGWKTGSKVWGAVTKLFRDATSSKDPTLRAIKSNPCDNLEGPDRGHDKAKQWLYPSEFAALISCEAVPLRWRRIYAVTVYLYLRLGEARALNLDDLDLVHGVAHVHSSTDERGQEVREYTKTGSVRLFRAERALLPLLNAMAVERAGQGRLFDSIDDAAGELRDHLLRAGVSRPALHRSTETSLAIRFHDLRATGITWAALRGDAPIEIRDRAGHAELEQTNAYMRRAAAVGAVGEPFPPLAVLLSVPPGIVPDSVPEALSISQVSIIDAVESVRRGGLEPPWE